MKRLTLVAHKADETDILSALQSIGAVQVIRTGEAEPSRQLENAEADVRELSDALDVLRPYAAKKGLLSAPPETTVAKIQKEVPDALGKSRALTELQRELKQIESDVGKNEAVIQQLVPWETFPADMQTYASAKAVRYFTGLIGAADVPRLEELEEDSEYQLFGGGTALAALVACPADAVKSVAAFLKSLDWTDVAFPKLPGTPAEAIRRLAGENAALLQKRGELQAQLVARSGENDEIAGAFDAAVIARDRAKAAEELSRTAATFVLEGWIRGDQETLVRETVAKVTDAFCFETRDPEPDEVPPSVVQENRFAAPFENVTNLYSRPDPNGIDATPYMAPFYVLLFGLMLSDTGYGLILALGCWLFQKFKKPTGAVGGFAKVLFWGGLSTMVWGVLVGTFFGLDFDVLFGTQNVFPLLVDPMEDPISMLILCFGLGLLHILFGVGLKMKMSFERGDWETAIFDNLSWIFIIFGLLMLVLPATKTYGLILAAVGALMILFMKGRAKKNPFARTVSGLGELYQITSYLSDVLSYARLFALGIATGVIASVFNDLCAMLMGSEVLVFKILGILVAIALLAALHLFNIGINTLGAFVHCARLQYVEFYGKFYEAGGRPFEPLRYRTKHVRLSDAPTQ